MTNSGELSRTENGRLLVSTTWLCDNLPTTRKTLTMWAKDGMPKHSRGWWDLVDVLSWRGVIGSRGAAQQESVSLQQKKLEYETALKEEQAEYARFRNEMNAQKYVPRADVEKTLGGFMVVFKKAALLIPRRVAGELSSRIGAVEAKELEIRIKDIVCNALEQMSVNGDYDGV